MRARLVQIGNSRGVRIPKPLIQEANLKDEVDIHVREGAIIITSKSKPRAGWAESADLLKERGEDRLLDSAPATEFDENEWKW